MPAPSESGANHERDVARFDRWASSYDRGFEQWVFFRPLYAGVLRIAAEVAPAPGRVLDVGCGTGLLLRSAALRYPEASLAGVDPSAEMIRVAAARDLPPAEGLPSGVLEFSHAQAEHLPFPDGRFGLVLSTMSFHHWADQKQGLREAARVLAPGGVFLLADHFVTRLQRPFYVGRRRQGRFHTPAEVDVMLREAGFSRTRWHDGYRLGPLLLVPAVSAGKDRP